ncbi:MAG: type II toxin-antitoxin system VapC family toxin [Sulfobacillus sp.]
MRWLLDTHVYLWYLADSAQLSAKARRLIAGGDEVFVSAASIWEAAIKVASGKLEVDLTAMVEGIAVSGFIELPVLARHAAAVSTLPPHHRDPFDRLLVAQALQEPLRLLTCDPMLASYQAAVELI